MRLLHTNKWCIWFCITDTVSPHQVANTNGGRAWRARWELVLGRLHRVLGLVHKHRDGSGEDNVKLVAALALLHHLQATRLSSSQQACQLGNSFLPPHPLVLLPLPTLAGTHTRKDSSVSTRHRASWSTALNFLKNLVCFVSSAMI